MENWCQKKFYLSWTYKDLLEYSDILTIRFGAYCINLDTTSIFTFNIINNVKVEIQIIDGYDEYPNKGIIIYLINGEDRLKIGEKSSNEEGYNYLSSCNVRYIRKVDKAIKMKLYECQKIKEENEKAIQKRLDEIFDEMEVREW